MRTFRVGDELRVQLEHRMNLSFNDKPISAKGQAIEYTMVFIYTF